jgi:hypothetical protein
LIPNRSADRPINGTARLPIPQAKPIISDDTVAAPAAVSDWAKVTLTGSVLCSSNPPMASIAVKPQGDSTGAAARNGTEATSVATMTRRGPKRSASGPPKNPPIPLVSRYRKTAELAWSMLSPRRVRSVGAKVMNPYDVAVRSTTVK